MSKGLYLYRLAWIFAVACTCAGCSEKDYSFWLDQPEVDIIRIGGVETEELIMPTTRAAGVDAETVSWLVQPLKNGLDITYGLYNATPNHEDVAILKLVDSDGEDGNNFDIADGGLAVYSFKYRADRSSEVGAGNDAIWYNNGFHYFQGVHVPERIRYISDVAEVEGTNKAPGLVLDQHDATETGTDAQLGNYTLLSHYLGMPANYRLTATVERIKLPFRHRLARVVAFVLIDPELNTTLKGYKKDAQGATVTTEDPNTTSIRFCNVKVLQGVKDVVEAGGHHNLTPTWTQARKVVPHFDGERGSYSYKTLESFDDSFKFYKKESDIKSEYLYPTSDNWKSVHDAPDHKGYVEVNYGKVPVYDIIVRPTYTDAEHVMYDEAQGVNASGSNKIDFELELENGLRYEKEFEFDLDANFQTVVYLRISREHVDYNASGSDLWVEDRKSDGWYGVNNKNGNTLSKAGSSWQRAYTYTQSFTETPNNSEGVTDGHFYNSSTSAEEREKAQYFTADYKDIWVEKFLQAYKGGAHHGDYFVLRGNIAIDARLVPKDFVFTGHLDGQDNAITLTNVGENVYKEAESLVDLFTESGGTYTSYLVPTLYVKLSTPVYYTSEELAIVEDVSYVKSTLTWKDEQKIYYTEAEAEAENAKHHKQIADSEGRNPGEEGYVDTRDPNDYEEGYILITNTSIKETIEAHYETNDTSVKATITTIKNYDITYPEATTETSPSCPTTLEQLKTGEYYTDDHSGIRFVCPDLYQYSHESRAFLFAGLDGTYTTAQEDNSSIPAAEWEANVHKETNKSTFWVPTAGYRAEVLNVKMVDPATLFKADAVISGNVQNCWNGSVAIDNNTPAIPQYK